MLHRRTMGLVMPAQADGKPLIPLPEAQDQRPCAARQQPAAEQCGQRSEQVWQISAKHGEKFIEALCDRVRPGVELIHKVRLALGYRGLGHLSELHLVLAGAGGEPASRCHPVKLNSLSIPHSWTAFSQTLSLILQRTAWFTVVPPSAGYALCRKGVSLYG